MLQSVTEAENSGEIRAETGSDNINTSGVSKQYVVIHVLCYNISLLYYYLLCYS